MDGMDLATARLILEWQLEDARQIEDARVAALDEDDDDEEVDDAADAKHAIAVLEAELQALKMQEDEREPSVEIEQASEGIQGLESEGTGEVQEQDSVEQENTSRPDTTTECRPSVAQGVEEVQTAASSDPQDDRRELQYETEGAEPVAHSSQHSSLADENSSRPKVYVTQVSTEESEDEEEDNEHDPEVLTFTQWLRAHAESTRDKALKYVEANSVKTSNSVTPANAPGQQKITDYFAKATTTKLHECTSCTGEYKAEDLHKTPCDHSYCTSCLITMFNMALTDLEQYPVRCCHHDIAFESVSERLPSTLVNKFTAKKPELDSKDRTYCHQPKCSTFIDVNIAAATDPEGDEDILQCPTCSKRTCKLCKGAAHGVEDCPNDEAARMLRETAKAQGWQSCPSCKRVVELAQGCNHITCPFPCAANFCYICGAIWKTCDCDQWQERDLVAGGIIEDPPEADRCEHPDWDRIRGRTICEECEDLMVVFIWRCSGCHMRLCTRCREEVE